MRYKLEIIADSMAELAARTAITATDLSKDDGFKERIESKGMETIFFTKEANIYVFDPMKENEEEE